MNNKLAIQDLAALLAARSGMDTKSSAAFVKAIFEIVQEYVAKDKVVKIKGFGTFKLVSVSDRESVNVNTGERIVISGHTKLSFTPDATLKDAVNKPFSDFETTLLKETTPIEEMEKISVPEEETVAEASVDDAPMEDSPVEETSVNDAIPDAVPDADSSDETAVDEDTTVDETVVDNTLVEDVSSETVVAEQEQTPSRSAVTDNASYPMAAENMLETEKTATKGRWHAWLYVLLTFVLMATSYFCGYHHVLDNLDISLRRENTANPSIPNAPECITNEKAEVPVSPDSLVSDTAIVNENTLFRDTTTNVAVQVKEEDYKEMARYYPQVKDGEYLIVGEAGVHHMQVGETLYRISGKELGDQKLIRYIIVFNNFEDPNILHTGQPIRIPKLVKKTTQR